MQGRTIAFACAAMMCWLVANEVEALQCSCPQCHGGVCTVLGPGGSCYAQLFLVDGIKVQPITRGCYDDSAVSQTYCGTEVHKQINGTNSWGYLKIECCSDKDECNREGELSLTVNTATTSAPSTSTSIPTTPDDPKLECYTYNLKKSGYRSFCHADAGFCYWLVRRNKTGDIIQQKQGCSNTCNPEDRDQFTRHCCNTSYCNAFPDDEPSSSPPVVTTASSCSSSSVLSQPLPSSRVLPLSRTSSTSVDDDSTSPATSATESLEISPYLVASVALGMLYLLILVVLVVLVAGVCIRQKRLAQSLHDKTSLYSQSTSSTSV